MADLTLLLVLNQLLSTSPTHILIERQRFRSGGRAAVQEWTLRVNTLEAMIYATLRTLRALEKWKGEIYSIAPARVGPFWLEGLVNEPDAEADMKMLESKKSAKARNKRAKIDLVASWLGDGKIEPRDGASATAQSYLQRWKGKGARKKAVSDDSQESAREHFDKLDDLADCLLQGLAWVKWEDNKRLLAKDGPASLL